VTLRLSFFSPSPAATWLFTLSLHALFRSLQALLQKLAGGAVQLALHQPVGDVHHGDFHTARSEAISRLQAQQAAADDNGMLVGRSEEHTSELQSRENLVCRLLLEKKKNEQ